MICVHPSVTHSRETLSALQLATGLRVALGQSYLRLVNPDGSAPAAKPAKPKFANRMTDYTPGGNAA